MKKSLSFLITTVAYTFYTTQSVRAASVISFTNLDDLLQSIILTLQHYTLPIMSIILAFLGIRLILSGDDTSSKDLIKSWMLKIVIGGAIIFGATVLATSIKTAVSGV